MGPHAELHMRHDLPGLPSSMLSRRASQSRGQPPCRERRCPSRSAGRLDRPNGDEATFPILA